ncbi:anthranilate synthase OS=Streptomyces glaucescens OX=1907 GN=SGLAU_09650 PE=4 SV=1 [Streptomyces glaucescens]
MQEPSAELEGTRWALVRRGGHLHRDAGQRAAGRGFDVTVRRYDEPGLREAVACHEGPLVLGPDGGSGGRRRPEDAVFRGPTAEVLEPTRTGCSASVSGTS